MGIAKAHFSDNQLRRLFLEFNRLYWNDSLPHDTEIVLVPLKGKIVGLCAKQTDGSFIITLCPSITGFPRYTKLILIHEMCHIATWESKGDSHGKAWKKEVLRVLTAGAVKYI